MEYKVVYAWNRSIEECLLRLEEKANLLCEQGWKLTGGVGVLFEGAYYEACQSMTRVKYEEVLA